MLDIQLLGTPSVTVDGNDVEVDTRKAIAVLAYLVIEGTVERDLLATMFWADSPPDRARATLRRTLSALRSGIGSETLESDRTRVRLLDGFSCDVSDFTAAIAETGTHGHEPGDVCARCVPPLTRAATLYRGDFLGSFSVRDAPDFEDWARSVTESLRLQAGEALRRLAHAHAASGDYSSAIGAAKRWIGLDELHEPAHRLVMLLGAWAGDRAAAIKAYRDFVAILDRELGVAPLEETTELFEAILDEDLPPAPGLQRPVKAYPTPEPPATETDLIDRVDAIERLDQAVAGSRTSSQSVIVSGDSWMGKTRLLEHALADARSSGGQVAWSTAFRAETHLPYGVAIQLLESLIEFVDDEGNLASWVWEELARLLPRLTPHAVPPDTGQLGELRLRDAFLSLVELVANKGALTLVVDDAQWIDPASANLIAYLRRRAEDLPLLVVIATRSTEDLHPSLREWVSDVNDHVVLAPLEAADLTDDRPLGDLQSIVDATGGIPLLVKEGLDAGGVSADSSSVTRYIDSRRARLTDLASQVMTAAAVLDGMCDASLLRDTSGRTEEEVVEAVEELISAGLLREQDDERLRFTLDVVERVTYESTSLIRRRLLHKRAATAMQGRARSHTDARLATAIAGHLREAGDDDAADWYRRAGDLARGVFANSEAVTAYETAIALGYGDVGAVRLALGELSMTVGDYETANRELQAAASQSEGATLALVEHRIGNLHRVLGRFDLAEESFALAAEEHPRRSGLYADWALLRDRVGDGDGAIDLAYRALGVAETDSETARARNVLGLVVDDEREARDHVDRALEASAEMGPDRMAALNNKAHLLAGAGDHGAAIALVKEAVDIAVRAGYRHQHAALLNHLADLNHRAGNREDAEAALTQAVTIFAEIDSGDWRPEVWLLRRW
jgi:DNA-binding SARP family transcriptional activator